MGEKATESEIGVRCVDFVELGDYVAQYSVRLNTGTLYIVSYPNSMSYNQPGGLLISGNS